MGKRGHHKKNEKKENAKVKFKVGRTLPKGQNITDTSFKVKKIVIKEQLKTGGLEPVTKRNLTLKETLARLQHYNVNVKLENLNGLKEILTNNQDMLTGNLQAILERLADLISDREPSVRREAIAQLANLIGRVPSLKLSPFLCLLCSYLGAALSHINKEIQLDALRLLAGILSSSSVSALILAASPATPSASHPFDLILQGLINQISEQKETYLNEKTSGWERKLSVNPGGKLGDVQRRTKVLAQLCSLLKAALHARRKSCSKEVVIEGPRCVMWEDVITADGYVPIYGLSNGTHVQGLALSQTLTSSFGIPSSISSSEPLGECEKLKMIVTSIVPILLESWKEVAPVKEASSNYMLTTEAGELLRIILDLLTILLEALMLYDKESSESTDTVEWFRTQYSKSFFDLFMPIFPFFCSGLRMGKRKQSGSGQKRSQWIVKGIKSSQHEANQEAKKETANGSGKASSECFYSSLLMAQLYCRLELTPVKKHGKKATSQQNYISKIFTFLTKSLQDSGLCHHYGKEISGVVWQIVSCRKMPLGHTSVSRDDVKLLIHSVILCCESGCPHAKDAGRASCPFFQLLCRVLKERDLAGLQRLQSFETWVKALPSLLCFPCSQAVDVLAHVAQRTNLTMLNETIKAGLPDLFKYMKTSQEISDNRENLQKALALLHWVRNWNKDDLNKLGDIIKIYPQEASSLVELFRARKDYYGEESEFSVLLESTDWWHAGVAV